MAKRNYVAEIVEKQERLRRNTPRIEQFRRRVIPLVYGYRTIKQLPRSKWRDEWLKYGAIGYIACVEGYFRLLYADLINGGESYLYRIVEFKDLKFTTETVLAIHSKKVTIGEFVSHLLPVNNVNDINRILSVLLDIDYLEYFHSAPLNKWNTQPLREVLPETVGTLGVLFDLRHLFVHEIATKGAVPVRKIERGISAAATFVSQTEELITRDYLAV